MSRFITQRAFDFVNHINRELIDEVIQTPVIIYKVNVSETRLNLYGEPVGGAVDYMSGVQLYCLIDPTDYTNEEDGFGVDVNRNVNFYFLREKLKGLDLYPEHGDIIKWNDSYYEIDNIRGARRFGGLVDFKVDIRCETHMTRRSRINIEPRVR